MPFIAITGRASLSSKTSCEADQRVSTKRAPIHFEVTVQIWIRKMKHLLLVLATAYLQSSPSESQWISTKRWEDFRPTNHNNWPDGWKVRSEESEDNRYR